MVVTSEDEHRSTPALERASRATGALLGDREVLDALLPLWCEARTGLDGVWWDDDLDPMRLSAPRGCIPADRVSEWAFAPTEVEPEEECDHEDGETDDA